jgi:hypothetical protein
VVLRPTTKAAQITAAKILRTCSLLSPNDRCDADPTTKAGPSGPAFASGMSLRL